MSVFYMLLNECIITDPALRNKPPNIINGMMQRGAIDNATGSWSVEHDNTYPVNSIHNENR